MFFDINLWPKVSADLLMHKSRSVLAISSIAIGLFIVGTLLGMMDLQLGSMDKAHQQSQPSHINLILKQDADFAVAEPLKNLDGVGDIDRLTQFTTQYKTPKSAQWQTGTVIFRPDYNAQTYDRMTLVSGVFPQKKSMAVERLSARYAGINNGDALEFATATGSETFVSNGVLRQRHKFPTTTDKIQRTRRK